MLLSPDGVVDQSVEAGWGKMGQSGQITLC